MFARMVARDSPETVEHLGGYILKTASSVHLPVKPNADIPFASQAAYKKKARRQCLRAQ
jgi:hypothetical protein